jgi:peptide/nickel transport system substrate-binding protein
LGVPQYGGEMVLRVNKTIVTWDPYFGGSTSSIMQGWLEKLHADDWTLDPAIFDYKIMFRPPEYVKGSLAESWEMPDASTYVVHLRKGIHWQDIPPVNGREFTADDVVWHYNRFTGMGSGFTKPSPYYLSNAIITAMTAVTAVDKYTVSFKFKQANTEVIIETLQGPANQNLLEAREAVEKWGDIQDWHHAIGTGPFILTDFVDGSSATLVKNPNYWGYDERYPQNKLPYVDKITYLIIPDIMTALAGMRTAKLDVMDGVALQQAQSIQKTNPEILQVFVPASGATTLDPRNDVAPFNDIRVRKAMQMAIDLPTIASSYYGGSCLPYPATLTSIDLKGWGWPYEQWPQALKDEYAYNPTGAKKLLADAGFPNGFKTNVVADNAGDLDLLQIVKAYFTQVSIDMDIRLMDSASWAALVNVARKYEQLSYKSGGVLGITFEPTRQVQRFQSGTNSLLVNDPTFDSFYTKAMASTTIDEVKKVLRDANEYVARQHYTISLLSPRTYALYQPWIKGYNGQDRSILTQTIAPLFLSFYGARIWVDQKLKTSMGH